MHVKVRRQALHIPLSDQLRGIIRARNLTPYAVAQSAGVAPSVVSRFCNGERGLSTDTLDKVADALGLELRETRRGVKR
jgi:plasmid maintenance system antidote protein VapI